MEDQATQIDKTSRRNFTKSMFAAAVAAPLAASMVGCKAPGDQANVPTPTASSETLTGPTIVKCAAKLTEEHIPPMTIDGSGSLRIELSNKLKTGDSASPFIYIEDGIRVPNERYGELESVLIISEFFPKVNNQFMSIANYVGLPAESQLLLWYQKIFPADAPGTGVADVLFETVATYPPNDPDVRIIGGPGNGRYFKMILKHKALPATPDPTHKDGRQWRYTHQADPNIPGLGRHFRIGQWKIVGSDGVTVVAPNFEGRGALDYRICPTFEDFHGT